MWRSFPARKALLALALAAMAGLAVAGGGKAIDPNYLSITDCPGEPGCAAIVLLDEAELSTALALVRVSRRRIIKVFTDAGIAAHADVVVTERPGYEDCRNLKGRTVLPDGQIIPLDQESIFVKPTYRKGILRLRAKSAKFPGVVRGAIIDYSYDLYMPKGLYNAAWTWKIQDEIPVLRAHLTLRPGVIPFSWRIFGPEQSRITHTSPRMSVDYFHAENMPSLPREPFSPPTEEVRTRLLFYMLFNQMWFSELAELIGRGAGIFLEKNAGIPEKVKELVAPDDPPLEKVRRIYRFIQHQVGTEEERLSRTASEDLMEADNVGEVLKRGYGDDYERTMLFLAMVKEVGLPPGLLLTTDRRHGTLNVDAPDVRQLESFAAAVNLDGVWRYYDPAVRHCPFGMLAGHKEAGLPNALLVTPRKPRKVDSSESWETQVNRILKEGTNMLLAIPFSRATDNVLRREASVRLEADSSAQIQVREQAEGQPDLDRRERYGGKTYEEMSAALAKELHGTVPGAELLSASFDGLDDPAGALTIRYSVSVPALAVVAGDRMVVTPSLFAASAHNPFTAETRLTPVHFPHTQKTVDRITYEIPRGYAISEQPEGVILREGAFLIVTSFEAEEGRLVFTRRVDIDAAIWPIEAYPQLRSFFERVQVADRQAIVLRRRATE
ncbi:MAG TPA: DUF3857 domain-containing protein [Candidatus Polarisedimenticolia bacterium]|jgi:hypothetical protein